MLFEFAWGTLYKLDDVLTLYAPKFPLIGIQ